MTSWAICLPETVESEGFTSISGRSEFSSPRPRAPFGAEPVVRGAWLSPEGQASGPSPGPCLLAALTLGRWHLPLICLLSSGVAGGAVGALCLLYPEPFLVPKPPVKTGSDEAEFTLHLH